MAGGAAVLALAARQARIARERAIDAIRDPEGIEWSGFIDVRGTRQWLLIRGRRRSNELVLFLHGGPGSPVTGLAGTRYQGALEERFVVVHWEQRGAGKSYRAGLSEPLTLETYVADALAVTDQLRNAFGKEKIFLVGHSHGGLLGAHLVARFPERYHAFLAVGPLVDATRQEQLSAAYVRDFYAERGETHAVARLDRLGAPPYADPFRAVMAERWLLARTPGFSGPGWPLRRATSELLTCPYYRLRDLVNYYRGSRRSLRQHLTSDYWSLDLKATHTEFAVPVFILVGANDQNTPTSLAREYFQRLRAPRKELVIVDGAGHMVFFEAPARFNHEVIRLFSGLATAS
ncbi:MAG TPA: alpha/beta hydrolase [Myxococcaceae bacterium]|nr:alpha/beta hydrolase [Myxococcaceae bacterium]